MSDDFDYGLACRAGQGIITALIESGVGTDEGAAAIAAALASWVENASAKYDGPQNGMALAEQERKIGKYLHDCIVNARRWRNALNERLAAAMATRH